MTFMLITVFGALFAFIVGAAEGDEGFVLGLLLGVLSGLYLSLRNKFGRLERRLADTEQALDALAVARHQRVSQIRDSRSKRPWLCRAMRSLPGCRLP